jgi:hypothetical protein
MTAHPFARSGSPTRCVICGLTRNAKAHKAPQLTNDELAEVEEQADAGDGFDWEADAAIAEDQIAEEEAQAATVERYRAPSGNRDEDRFRAVCNSCDWKSLGWHSNRTIEGRRLAERDAAQHRCAKVEPEPTMTLWVGWRVADAAMARGGSLAAKLEAKAPNKVLDRTVKLTRAECEALSSVASDLENAVLGTKGAGPIVYSVRTLQARLAAFWA